MCLDAGLKWIGLGGVRWLCGGYLGLESEKFDTLGANNFLCAPSYLIPSC